jgi:hypothetical protein
MTPALAFRVITVSEIALTDGYPLSPGLGEREGN